MKAFKLLHRRTLDGTLRSEQVVGKAAITYKEDFPNVAPEWLAAQGYHPLVFTSMEAVLRYLGTFEWPEPHYAGEEIWEVEGEMQPQMPQRATFQSIAAGELHFTGVGHWPPDSAMMTPIRLVRKIKRFPE